MGMYDRDYYREDERPAGWSEWSITARLIILTVAVHLADFLLFEHRLLKWGGLDSQVLYRPWTLLTYGFLHDPESLRHLLFNMIGVWIFGREMEDRFGRTHFLAMYLTAIIVSGAAWLLTGQAAADGGPLIGASGAVMALVILFACINPQRQFYLYFIPVRAWALAGIFLLMDLLGVVDGSTDHVAHLTHLAGAAYGYAFFRTGWTLQNLWPSGIKLGSRPKLRVHRDDDTPAPAGDESEAQLDELLDKVFRLGEGSLTAAERQKLERISRKYQQRRQ
jgi:membrane associated rhomboid family serine protease